MKIGNILSDKELIEIGKTVGADIPFFIKNYPCRVKGIGENLERIENNLECDIVLVKPEFGVSTKEAYNLYSTLKNKKDAGIEKIIEGLKENNLEKVEKNSENILEQGLLTENENIKSFRKELNEKCSNRFFMSGSGSCYYTFCPKGKGNEYAEALKTKISNCQIYSCSFLEKCSNRFFMSGSGSCYYTFCPKGKGNEYAEALKTKISNCQIYSCSFL